MIVRIKCVNPYHVLGTVLEEEFAIITFKIVAFAKFPKSPEIVT